MQLDCSGWVQAKNVCKNTKCTQSFMQFIFRNLDLEKKSEGRWVRVCGREKEREKTLTKSHKCRTSKTEAAEASMASGIYQCYM